jgi:hypothetical protein
MRTFSLLASIAVTGGLALMYAPGCGSSNPPGFDPQQQGGDPDSGTGPVFVSDDGGDGRACVGLECKRVDCGGSGKTTVSGKVYDPSGKLGLYNVIVYVPNAPLDPMTHGATCDRCGSTVKAPVASALTNTKGEFVLEDVPVMDDMPLVVQVGKWRRQFKVPKIQACTVNAIPDTTGADKTLRLPKNQTEGDMPKMAISLGGADNLPCLFSRMGIDAAEFTNAAGAGAMHVYKGANGGDVQGGGATKANANLWADVNQLKRYDIVILTCEGSEYNNEKPPASMDAMRDYMNAGGRVLASHFHYTWFKNGPTDVRGIATWTPGTTANPYTVDTTFPKGQALGEWLVNNGATTDPTKINLTSVANDVGKTNPGAQRWIYTPAAGAQQEGTRYISFNTPIGTPPEQQCGRGTLSDIHVSDTQNATTVPTSCTTSDLTPQEKAFVFLFFDLSACVQDESKPPEPPKPR